jgi:hypothetical protein
MKMLLRRPIVIAAITIVFAMLILSSAVRSPFASDSSGGSMPTFAAPINLSNDAGAASFPWITNVGLHVYVAWTEEAGGMMFRASADGGYNWNPPVSSPAMRISNPGGVSQAPIVCADGSDVYVAWSQSVGTTGLQVFVASSTNNGMAFSSPVQLSAGSPPDGWVTPVCAASGHYAYVAWVNGQPNQSWVSSSDDNGVSWSAPFNYSHTREPEAAAVGANAYIYSNRDVVVSHNGGNSWDQVLYNTTMNGDEGQISASGPYVYIATQTKTNNGFIHLYYSDDSGDSFHHINDSTPNLNDSWEPMVGSYGSSAWIAFLQYPGGANANISVFSTHNGGASWSTPVSLSGTGHDLNYPFTVSSSDGKNVFVGYTQEEGAGYWVFRVGYSSDGGDNWTAAPGIDVSQNTQGEAAFQNDLATGAISSYGSYCFATWEYVNGASTQVYFTTSAPGSYPTTTTSTTSSSSSSSTSSSSTASMSSTYSSITSSSASSITSSSTTTAVHSSSSSFTTLTFPPVTSSTGQSTTTSTEFTSTSTSASTGISPTMLWIVAVGVILAAIIAASVLFVRLSSPKRTRT